MNTPDPSLPFFAYGIFSPGQIAFSQIKRFVCQANPANITGVLYIRDGVPLLAPGPEGQVKGHRIEFNNPDDAASAYQAIQTMEPSTQYFWRPYDEMNVLNGRSLNKGADVIEGDDWGWRDPAFDDALSVVDEILDDKQIEYDDLRSFYRLQGAYMVLWSSIERYVSLRYGPGPRNRPGAEEKTCSECGGTTASGDGILKRVKQIAGEAQFEASLRATAPTETRKLRRLFRSDNPGEAVSFDPAGPPAKAIDYLYQVRSNITHRGKAQRLDQPLLRTATTEVLRVFRDVLRAAEEEAQWTVVRQRY